MRLAPPRCAPRACARSCGDGDGGLAEARVETFEGYQSTNIFTHA